MPRRREQTGCRCGAWVPGADEGVIGYTRSSGVAPRGEAVPGAEVWVRKNQQTNTVNRQLFPGVLLGVGGGEGDLAEFNGVIFISRAVPGAEIWYFKKR